MVVFLVNIIAFSLALMLFTSTTDASDMKVKPDTGIFLSKANGSQLIMFDPRLEYAFGTGHFPCGRPTEKLLALNEKDREQYIKKNCNLNLYSYGKQGVEPVRVTKTEVKSVQGMCAGQEPQIEAVINPLAKPSYFVTSIKPVAADPIFIPAAGLVASGLSSTDKSSLAKKIGLPNESKIAAVYSYNYKPWKFLVQVEKTRIMSGVPDNGRPNGQIKATDFYISGDKTAQKLTPNDIHLTACYGEVSQLIGLAYLTKKDRPDILIGKEDAVTFIVLSKTFNHIVFPFVPPGGC